MQIGIVEQQDGEDSEFLMRHKLVNLFVDRLDGRGFGSGEAVWFSYSADCCGFILVFCKLVAR